MRRHKIKSVMVSKNHKAFGFYTNGGTIWFSFKSTRVSSILRHHLPHIYEELIELKPQSKKELEGMFLGRYVYGRSREALRGKVVVNVLT